MWAFQITGAGIRRDDRIVVCSEFTDESAARAFWFLEYLGHERVSVLDGGVRAWAAAGQPLTHEAEVPTANPYPFEAVASVCAAWSDVAAAIDDPETVILDTRTDGEWYGEDARGAARAGKVPSAVHLEWIHNLDDKGCMLDVETLRARYAAVGVSPQTPVIAYCNTGYRSAHAYLALRRLGHGNVRNYVASWQEWGNRMECPIVVEGGAESRVSSRVGSDCAPDITTGPSKSACVRLPFPSFTPEAVRPRERSLPSDRQQLSKA